MIDEGYIKFDCAWTEAAPPPQAWIEELNASRRRLHDLGLIGYLAEEDVDFGNISVRGPEPLVMTISGTRTGRLPALDASHYALVTACDTARNHVSCRGAVKASSETLTHAAIYALDPLIRAVIHIHSDALWRELAGRIPTSADDVPYGTPEMAQEFSRLHRTTDLEKVRIAVMGGHPGGLISFGCDLHQAENALRERIGIEGP